MHISSTENHFVLNDSHVYQIDYSEMHLYSPRSNNNVHRRYFQSIKKTLNIFCRQTIPKIGVAQSSEGSSEPKGRLIVKTVCKIQFRLDLISDYRLKRVYMNAILCPRPKFFNVFLDLVYFTFNPKKLRPYFFE